MITCETSERLLHQRPQRLLTHRFTAWQNRGSSVVGIHKYTNGTRSLEYTITKVLVYVNKQKDDDTLTTITVLFLLN
jgi:hypothetical protein